MSKISREDNKKRYKTGMYPTQQDFENVFDSYVHKDDTIDPSKIVSGNENIVDIINRKAEEKHSHEIKDVDGLEKFITEMTSLLEIVRDPETGEISQSKLKTLTDGIAALRDDIDTNADNVAGHESRIQTNEAALEKVYQILGKDAKESIADLADRFAALSGNYANVYAFINKVKQFLEDADASDETINRWQEIETFLQGITDTETLTGLLEQQRTDLEGSIAEAIAAIPQGNYLKLVPDLDAYTDAPDGEIVKYTGPTTDQYTHGFDYERKAGIAQQELVASLWPSNGVYERRIDVPASANILTGNVSLTMTSTDKTITIYRDSNTVLVEGNRNIGDIIWSEEDSDTITQSSETNSTITVKGTCYQFLRDFQKSNNEVLTVFREQSTGLLMAPFAADGAPDAFCFIGLSEDLAPIFITRAYGVDMGEAQPSASWQLCPASPAIS